jgi:hypothetical protein
MKYTSTYELICALVKIDPGLHIQSVSWEWAQGMDIHVHTSDLLRKSKHFEKIQSTIFECLCNNIWGVSPTAVTSFGVEHFQITGDGLTAEAHWHVDSDGENEIDIFAGEPDIWGSDAAVSGIRDFEFIRDTINDTGEVCFEVEVTDKGWVKDTIKLQLMDSDQDTPSEPRSIIEDNMPALEGLLKKRIKKLTRIFINEITDKDTKHYRFIWSSGGSEVYLSNDYDQNISGCLSAEIVGHLGSKDCKMLFDYPCECELED